MTVSDLSPDALARLEAKLVADLEMVRKVRALLEEHLPRLGAAPVSPTAPVAAPAPAPAAMQDSAPGEKRKSYDEVLLDCLAGMPAGTFAPQEFRRAVYHATKRFPETTTVKTFLNRMIRRGKVAVAEKRTGRRGSLYRSLLPRPVPPEQSTAPAEPADGAGESPPGRAE